MNFLYQNIIYEYDKHEIELQEELIDFIKDLYAQPFPVIMVIYISILVVSVLVVVAIVFFWKKFYDSHKNSIQVFLKFDPAMCAELGQNCQNYLDVLIFTEKFNINRLDINDYLYVTQNIKMQNQITKMDQNSNLEMKKRKKKKKKQ